MFTDETADEIEPVCPHLRLAGDPSTWSPDPSPDNRCYRPAPVHEDHQAKRCLAEGHAACPGASPITSGPHRAKPRLMLGRQRVTRREAQELVRTVLATVALLGLLLVVFAGVLISGRAKLDGSAPMVASAGAEEGETAGSGDAETLDRGEADGSDPALPSGEDQDEGPAPTAETPEDSWPPADPPSPPVQAAMPPPAAPPAYIAEPEPAMAAGGTIYVVKRGDTLYSLARAHGVTVETLMEANNLEDQNSITAGQHLAIPEATIVP